MFTAGFLLLLLTQSCFGLSFSAFLLLPKWLALELSADEIDIGWVTSVGALAGVASFPVIGLLNDRLGRRPFVVLGNLLMVLTAAGMYLVSDLGPLIAILRILQGVAFAMVFNSSTTLVADRVAPSELARALGIFGVAMLGTNALTPAIVEWLADHHGWGSVFDWSIGWGTLGVLTACLLREKRRAFEGGAPPVGALGMLWREPRVRRIILVMNLAGGAFGTVFIFHQPFALEQGMTQVAGFFVAYALAAIVVRLFFSGLADQLGRQETAALSLMLYALAVASAALLRPGLLELIGGLIGMAHGIFYPACNALAIEGVPRERRGSMMSLYHGSFNGGTALALLCGGFLARWLGYPMLFVLVGVFGLAGAWLLWRGDLSEPRETEFPDGLPGSSSGV